MTEQSLRIQGMTCASCQVHVQRALNSVAGVHSASVNLMAHTATITSAHPLAAETLITAVRNSGYNATLPTTTGHAADHIQDHNQAEPNHLGLRALLALLAGALAMLLSMPLMATADAGDPLLAAASRTLTPLMPLWLMHLPAQPIRWLLALLSIAVIVFAAPEIYTAAWRAALHRSTNMNTLVALGTFAALASSLAATFAPAAFARNHLASGVYFEAVILILAFLLSGRWLEARARARATSALRSFAQLEAADVRLLNLRPSDATSDATSDADYAAAPETILSLDAIETNDCIRVLPGDRIPVDGEVLLGRSSVDESMLTGEPLPITRSTGSHVAAGTLNLDGVLVLRATAVGAASTLAQMQRLLESAQSSRAPMQRLADRASAIFVPSVLILSALTFTAWAIAGNVHGHHQGLARAFAIAIAVLIIACPCAMGLAVPAAITVAIGRAAQAGLLIKGGEALERLAAIDTLALDKTGTLTQGTPSIAAFVLAPGATFDAPTLIAFAAATERLSTHPLAHAIVSFAAAYPSSLTPQVSGLTILPGTGLTATVDQHALTLGNTAPSPMPPSDHPHATPIYLHIDNHLQAIFYAADILRPTAAEAIAQLRQLHINPILLTGDIASSAAPIAAQAGIDPRNIRAHLLPADKVSAIQQLQREGHRVAMAGDGLNDAGALAQSDAGLAMASGTGLAREAGDILLLHADLRLIPLSVRLARRTTRIMRQNLAWALLYNVIGIPLAAGILYPRFHILLSPILASAAMALSSVSVLANSLRLRRLPDSSPRYT
jgi:Cu+-exporting ATPase